MTTYWKLNLNKNIHFSIQPMCTGLESSLNDCIFASLSSHMKKENLMKQLELRRLTISYSKNVHFSTIFHHSHEMYTNAAKFNKYDNAINTRINYFSIHGASILNRIRYSRESEIYFGFIHLVLFVNGIYDRFVEPVP